MTDTTDKVWNALNFTPDLYLHRLQDGYFRLFTQRVGQEPQQVDDLRIHPATIHAMGRRGELRVLTRDERARPLKVGLVRSVTDRLEWG